MLTLAWQPLVISCLMTLWYVDWSNQGIEAPTSMPQISLMLHPLFHIVTTEQWTASSTRFILCIAFIQFQYCQSYSVEALTLYFVTLQKSLLMRVWVDHLWLMWECAGWTVTVLVTFIKIMSRYVHVVFQQWCSHHSDSVIHHKGFKMKQT